MFENNNVSISYDKVSICYVFFDVFFFFSDIILFVQNWNEIRIEVFKSRLHNFILHINGINTFDIKYLLLKNK